MATNMVPKSEQQKEIMRLCQSLPEGLPKPPTDLVDFALNHKKLIELKEKALFSEDPVQKQRAKENQKKFSTIIMENYKKALVDVDRTHTKAVVELKHIIARIEALKRMKEGKQ